MQNDAPHSNATARDYDMRLFTSLLKPSSLSGFACVLISLLFVGSAVVLTNFRGSSFERDILGFKQRTAQEKKQKQLEQEQAELEQQQALLEQAFTDDEFYTIGDDYAQINESFEDNSLLRNIPVMAFWMFVGVLVYFVVTGITDAFSSAANVSDELTYMHAKRKELLKQVYIKSAIRLVALVIWLVYIMLFFKMLVPYILAASRTGGIDLLTVHGSSYVLLAFVVMTVGLHVHIVMARLVVLRPRLFSQATSF